MPNSSQVSNSVTISAKRARNHGYRSIFKTGAVLAVQPHGKHPIMVRSIESFSAGEVVIKDKKGRRRPVALSTIRSLEIEAAVAEKIKRLPEEDTCSA